MAAKKETPVDKSSALSTVVAQIQKQYGEGAIVKLGDAAAHIKIESISTGALTLDLAGFVCPQQRCTRELNGFRVRPDGMHFSGPSAAWVSAWILDQLRPSKALDTHP